MEMTKESLLAAGYTEQQATAILAAHTKAVETTYVPKAQHDLVAGELKTAKAAVTERDKQIEGLKKFEGDATQLKTKVEELEKANKEKDDQYQAELASEKKRNAVKMALLEDAEGKPHDAEMVLGLFNMDQINLDATTGKIASGFTEQHAGLKKDKAFLFETKANPAGTPPNNPGWKPMGTPPGAGDPPPAGDTIADFGKSLAAAKLGMMGVKPSQGSGAQ